MIRGLPDQVERRQAAVQEMDAVLHESDVLFERQPEVSAAPFRHGHRDAHLGRETAVEGELHIAPAFVPHLLLGETDERAGLVKEVAKRM
jgi:hypothetical protein